jgi:tRNA/rRNA methyltransferase
LAALKQRHEAIQPRSQRHRGEAGATSNFADALIPHRMRGYLAILEGPPDRNHEAMAEDDGENRLQDGPAIILVEPQLGENIGMVARAMANFGLAELRLVNPRDGWPSDKARAAASRADHVIDGAALFEDVRAAVADLNFVYATTARARDGFKPVRGPVEAGKGLRARVRSGERTGIMFGRERFGLYNEEVALADEIVTFPVNPEFASLNIAQAVLLMSYEWMKSGLESETDTAFSGPDVAPAEKRQLHGLLDHLEQALDARGYFRPAAKKPKMLDNLRAVFSRPAFAEAEIKVLRGVVSSLDYFSPRAPRGEGYPERKAEADREAHDGGDYRRKPAPPEKKRDDG